MNTIKRLFGWCLSVGILLANATPAPSAPSSSEDKVQVGGSFPEEYAQHIDSVIDVSLITCQPSSNEIYSLYGHTAIHFVNRETGIDVAANWGIFSMNQKGFVWRFLMGTALYSMEIQPYDAFCQQYTRERRGIIEQQLDLTAREKLLFAEALQENSLPMNRDYPYDFLFDNCSTRARNIIIRCIEGELTYEVQGMGRDMSFRELIQLYTANHPWAQFGNEMLMGVMADRTATKVEAQFLPELLKNDFAKATVVRGTPSDSQPLVKETKVVVPYFEETADDNFPLRPRVCFLILLAVTIALTLVEFFTRKHFWIYDALLMLTCGLAGCFLTMMVFSKHPTVSLNLQLLLLNPLPLFFIWRMIRRSRRHRHDRQFVLWTLLICLFFIGNLFQHYAEGMNIAAAALLLRNVRLMIPMGSRGRRDVGARARRYEGARVQRYVRTWLLVIIGIGSMMPQAGHAAPGVDGFVINEVQVANLDMFIAPTHNFCAWVELYNPTDEAIDLGGLFFSDDSENLRKWQSPADMGLLESKGFFILWFDDQETSERWPDFKLDSSGGTLFISNASGTILLHHNYLKTFPRTSLARTTDGGKEWAVCTTPTPGTGNSEAVFVENEQIPLPIIDKASCVFSEPFDIHITIPEGCVIRYTLDGSIPTLENGTDCPTGTLHIATTTCLRVRAFDKHRVPSNVAFRTFLPQTMAVGREEAGMNIGDLSLPILSVAGDERFFYDDEIGVMVQGVNGRPGNGMEVPCNWNREWPRAVSFSYIDVGQGDDYNDDALFEISGAWSRSILPRPFKLKANKVFGHNKTLNHIFFHDKPFIRNRTLQMRNGIDTEKDRLGQRFKDAFISYVVSRAHLNLDMQSYQPVAHFINGQYKGVIDMREPNNKHYVFANYGWDEDEIDLFEAEEPDTLIFNQGTPDAFHLLYDLSFHADDDAVYEQIRQLLDVDEYINYMAFEQYIGNYDWIKNNMKWFRHRDGGRYRLILFDMEAAFWVDGMVSGWMDQTFEGWKMTTLFDNLMANATFRRQFIDTYCLMGGSVMWPERVNDLIDEIAEPVYATAWAEDDRGPFIDGYIKRWNTVYANSYGDYLKASPHAGLASTDYRRMELSNVSPAKVLMNGIEVPYGDYHGWFFPPVQLEILVPEGMSFLGWQDTESEQLLSEAPIFVLPDRDIQLRPLFSVLTDEERRSKRIPDIVINEVSANNRRYVNDHYKRNSWIELYNTSDHDIDLGGLFLSNDSTQLPLHSIAEMLPEDCDQTLTTVPAHGFLVVWCDDMESRTQLHAPFHLSADGGYVWIGAEDGSWSDTFHYPSHNEHVTIGRYPDGAQNSYVMNVPTIGKPNLRTSYMELRGDPSHNGIASVCHDNGLTLRYGNDVMIVEDKAHPYESLTIRFFTPSGMMYKSVTVNLCEGLAILPTSDLPHGIFIATTGTRISTASCRFCH